MGAPRAEPVCSGGCVQRGVGQLGEARLPIQVAAQVQDRPARGPRAGALRRAEGADGAVGQPVQRGGGPGSGAACTRALQDTSSAPASALC